MFHRNNPRRVPRLGLTLLELVVVMTILIALAGLLVALFPGFLKLAHTSTGGTNMPELNKVFQMHHQVQRGWPNYLDNLVDEAGSLYAKLPGDPTSAGYFLEPLTLEAEQAQALLDAGLTAVFPLTSDADIDDATYDCYGEGVVAPELEDAVPVATGLTVARLTTPGDIAKFKGHDDAVYVVFGVGQATPLVGEGGMMQDAPVHFGHNANTRPNEVYSRFAAVFRLGSVELVDDDDDPATPDVEVYDVDGPADFITCVGLHGGGIAVPWMPLKGFHHSDHSH